MGFPICKNGSMVPSETAPSLPSGALEMSDVIDTVMRADPRVEAFPGAFCYPRQSV
jgi:hypothetical protein